MIRIKDETLWRSILSGAFLCLGIGLLISQFRIRPGHSLSPIGMASQQDSAGISLILGSAVGIVWSAVNVRWFEIGSRLEESHPFLGRVLFLGWFAWFLLPLYCRAVTLDIYRKFSPHMELLPFLVLFPGFGFITSGLIMFFRRRAGIGR